MVACRPWVVEPAPVAAGGPGELQPDQLRDHNSHVELAEHRLGPPEGIDGRAEGADIGVAQSRQRRHAQVVEQRLPAIHAAEPPRDFGIHGEGLGRQDIGQPIQMGPGDRAEQIAGDGAEDIVLADHPFPEDIVQDHDDGKPEKRDDSGVEARRRHRLTPVGREIQSEIGGEHGGDAAMRTRATRHCH
jgi:hypothetical protein